MIAKKALAHLPDANGPFVYRFRTAPFHGAETGSTPVRAISEAVFVKKGTFGGRSSVWLEHSTVTREVAGSSPVGSVEIGDLPWW